MDRTPPTDQPADRPKWLKRVGWLALIWVASVAALFVVALALRALMGWIGMTA